MVTFLFMLLMQKFGVDLSGDSGLGVFLVIEIGIYGCLINKFISSIKKKMRKKEEAAEAAYYEYRRSLEGMKETYGTKLGTHIYRERQKQIRLAEAKARMRRRW